VFFYARIANYPAYRPTHPPTFFLSLKTAKFRAFAFVGNAVMLLDGDDLKPWRYIFGIWGGIILRCVHGLRIKTQSCCCSRFSNKSGGRLVSAICALYHAGVVWNWL